MKNILRRETSGMLWGQPLHTMCSAIYGSPLRRLPWLAQCAPNEDREEADNSHDSEFPVVNFSNVSPVHCMIHVNDAIVKYYDATTWPAHIGAAEIERLLCGNLVNPKQPPNCDSLAMLLKRNDVDSLNRILRKLVKPPPSNRVDVSAYLTQELGTAATEGQLADDVSSLDRMRSMGALQQASVAPASNERDVPPTILRLSMNQYLRNLSCAAEVALSPDFGRGERLVAVCNSHHGTSFLWWFASAIDRRCAMERGRVLVRRCDRETPWRALLARDGADQALCEMIRAHVESVVGLAQDPSKYCDPQSAYAAWMSETAWYFGIEEETESMKPLIMLDNSEVLARIEHLSLVHTSSGNPYTLLEALCIAIPSPYGVVVAGRNVQITTDSNFRSLANVTDLKCFCVRSAPER